jgi:N4 gp54-like protein|nr:MAG TPA: hypothetical protein [Caudoviricetes sp.]
MILKQLTIPERINVRDLTEQSLSGQGVLDVLLSTMRLHLDREYKEGRITGKEYSEAFIQAYTVTLEQAIQFLLQKEKQAYEIDLLEAQAEKLRKEIKLLDLDILIKAMQLEMAKIELEMKKIELLIKLGELELARAQLALLKWKIQTERAQTDPTPIRPGSVIGKQNEVLDAQIQGYKRDAEQKAAQIMSNIWITLAQNDSANRNKANGYRDNFIGRTTKALLNGIGVSVDGFDENDLTGP